MAFKFTEESDRFFDAILSQKQRRVQKVFEDICTIKRNTGFAATAYGLQKCDEGRV